MHPEMYLTIYRQQERELEQRLARRAMQTCCAPVAAAARSALAPIAARIASLRVTRQAAVCCPA